MQTLAILSRDLMKGKEHTIQIVEEKKRKEKKRKRIDILLILSVSRNLRQEMKSIEWAT
jgi:hypothetical protein